MVLLYKDPNGDSIKEMSSTHHSMDVRTSSKLSTIKSEHDLEGKVTHFKNLLKEKEDIILKLNNELAMIKVCMFYMHKTKGINVCIIHTE